MGQRGRPPKPTHLKLITGQPNRLKTRNEPRPEIAIPDAPDHLDAEGLKEWNRAGPELYAIGVLSRNDRAVFADYCVHWSRWVQAERLIQLMASKDDVGRGLIILTTNGNWIQNPVVGVANVSSREMMRCAEQLGMTPSARSRIEAHKLTESQEPKQNPGRFFDAQ